MKKVKYWMACLGLLFVGRKQSLKDAPLSDKEESDYFLAGVVFTLIAAFCYLMNSILM